MHGHHVAHNIRHQLRRRSPHRIRQRNLPSPRESTSRVASGHNLLDVPAHRHKDSQTPSKCKPPRLTHALYATVPTASRASRRLLRRLILVPLQKPRRHRIRKPQRRHPPRLHRPLRPLRIHHNPNNLHIIHLRNCRPLDPTLKLSSPGKSSSFAQRRIRFCLLMSPIPSQRKQNTPEPSPSLAICGTPPPETKLHRIDMLRDPAAISARR